VHAVLGRRLEEPQQRRAREHGRGDAPVVRAVPSRLLRRDERADHPAGQLHLNNGLSLAKIESWWLDELGLPRSCVRAATVNRPSSASRWRRNVHVYGTAATCVYSTFIVQSIYGAIQEYAGFERPAWLD
jgi:hypothetical protein